MSSCRAVLLTFLSGTTTGMVPYVATPSTPEAPPIDTWTKPPLPAPTTTMVSRARIEAEFYSDYNRRNWVAWSKIGEVSFEIDQENDAGWTPMPWEGWAYQMKELGEEVIVYGAKGITSLVPNKAAPGSNLPPTFGKRKVHIAGLLGKNAVCGDHITHFFIDALGQLCSLTSAGVKVAGFAEFLRPMKFAGKPILMHYDPLKQWVYICNGSVGYVYTAMGLGGGPKNLTGLMFVNNEYIAVSNGALTFDTPYFVTEVFDMESKDIKTVYEVDISSDIPKQLEGMLEFRKDTKQPYRQTIWKTFNHEGKVFFKVSGNEFKLHVRAKEDMQFMIDGCTIYTRLYDRTLKQIAFPSKGAA